MAFKFSDRCNNDAIGAKAAIKNNQKKKKSRKIIWCIAFAAILLLASQVMARPGYRSAFENTYPAAVGTRIDACNLCHNSPGGGDARNPYGLSYASSGHNFEAIENIDSDGDGYMNLQEIDNLTFPGDAKDHEITTGNITASPVPKASGFESVGTIAALFAVVFTIIYRRHKGKHVKFTGK